jgi:hypothetical protein
VLAMARTWGGPTGRIADEGRVMIGNRLFRRVRVAACEYATRAWAAEGRRLFTLRSIARLTGGTVRRACTSR